VVVAAPAPAAAPPVWLPPVIDPTSPVSGGEVHTLTLGDRTPDQFFPQNAGIRFALPSGVFNASRPTEQLQLTAERADGQPLPSWLVFNPTTRSFEGAPPTGTRGELVIKITARDASGNQADTLFRLQIGEQDDPAAPADGTQPVRKSDGNARPGRVSLQQQLRDLAPPRRTAAVVSPRPGPKA
jgi:hypothetical protein